MLVTGIDPGTATGAAACLSLTAGSIALEALFSWRDMRGQCEALSLFAAHIALSTDEHTDGLYAQCEGVFLQVKGARVDKLTGALACERSAGAWEMACTSSGVVWCARPLWTQWCGVMTGSTDADTVSALLPLAIKTRRVQDLPKVLSCHQLDAIALALYRIDLINNGYKFSELASKKGR